MQWRPLLGTSTASPISKTICVIQDYPKTEDGCRDIYLEEKAFELLDKILVLNPDGEYLFSINGKRIRTNDIRRSLYRICDAVEVPSRGLHYIRSFYATTLLDAHTDEEIVMSQLGHADINTTRNYYQYCKSEVYKKQEQIKKAINYWNKKDYLLALGSLFVITYVITIGWQLENRVFTRFLAGDERIELPPKVLETPIIPFDQSPVFVGAWHQRKLLYQNQNLIASTF